MKTKKRKPSSAAHKTPERLAYESDQRLARRTGIYKWIRARESDLKARINGNEELTKDFEFFTQTVGIAAEELLNRLCWDCNMMHADPQTVASGIKAETWPIEEQTLRRMLTSISAAGKHIENINKTNIAPGKPNAIVDSEGIPLERRKEKSLLSEFARLPEVVRLYHDELLKAVDEAARTWPGQNKRMRALVEEARKNSIFERIRLASPKHKYHADRLCRLVNAARAGQGHKELSQHSFVAWLSNMKKKVTRTASPRNFATLI
jgi:hypothetical protein